MKYKPGDIIKIRGEHLAKIEKVFPKIKYVSFSPYMKINEGLSMRGAHTLLITLIQENTHGSSSRLLREQQA